MSRRQQLLVKLARIAAVLPPRGLPTNRVFAIEDYALHLSFANIIIDGHRAAGREHGHRLPLAERIVHGVGHEMLGAGRLLWRRVLWQANPHVWEQLPRLCPRLGSSLRR